MKLLSQYPLIGYLLTIAGGILVVWYFARPKAKRPFGDVAELRNPLPTTTYQDGKAGISVPGCALDWSGDDSPALKMNESQYVEALETQSAIETPGAPVVKIKMPAQSNLESALNKCHETYIGPGPCYSKPYLEARREYHKLLAESGHISIRTRVSSKESLTKSPKRVSAKTRENARI